MTSYFGQVFCRRSGTFLKKTLSKPNEAASCCSFKLQTLSQNFHSDNDKHRYSSSNNNGSSNMWSSLLLGCVGCIVFQSKIKQKHAAFAATPFWNPEQTPAAEKPKGLREQYNFVSSVIKHASPAVVSIDATHIASFGYHHFKNEVQSNGSGFFVNSGGLVITNAHVVANASKLKIRMSDGRTFDGRVIAVDESLDIAAIQVDSKQSFPYINLGSVEDLQVGEWVVAIGSPFALQNTFTVGIVSNKCRSASELGIRGKYELDYIQTDASINMGNSGGPLVNLDAEVIGVNTMRLHSDGISFAIPIDHVKDFLDNLKNKTRTDDKRMRRWVGVMMLTLTPEVVQHLRMLNLNLPRNTRGVFVHKVIGGSPAAMSGVQPQDVIVSVNGQLVYSAKEVMDLVSKNEVLDMVIKRNGDVISIRVTPQVIEH